MILPSFWSSLKEATEDRIYFVLAIAAAFSILFGMIYSPKTGWWPGVSIFISLFIMIFITAICDYDKDKRFIELRIRGNESKVTVIRGRIGETQQVTNWNLCVGDICQFGPGSHIPVDCVVVKSTGLSLDEAKTCDAVMVPVGKGVDTDPFLLSGSFVISGTCTAVVAAVGANSTREHVAMQAEALEDTPLQNKLFKLSKSFTYIGFFSALVILITSLVVVVI
jgi:Ca2+-transporting ATPase